MSENNPHEPFFLENPADNGLVVFIHGFMGSPRQFIRLAETVHRQGLSAAALLLPGHGGSVKAFGVGTAARWQEHVDSEVERFANDYASIWLVGHSMGGLLAINAAVKYSAHIRGIFPIACPFKLTKFSALSSQLKRFRLRRVLSINSDTIKAAYRGSCSIQLSASLLWRIVKPMSEVEKLIQATKDNLPNIRIPMTAVYSTSDELTAIGSLEILKSGLDGVAFEHLVLSDSMHAYYPEHDMAAVEQALVNMVYGPRK